MWGMDDNAHGVKWAAMSTESAVYFDDGNIDRGVVAQLHR